MSTGQQLQNPLQLLGQYSDEEFDEEPKEGLNLAIVESSSPNDEVINGLFTTFVCLSCEGLLFGSSHECTNLSDSMMLLIYLTVYKLSQMLLVCSLGLG